MDPACRKPSRGDTETEEPDFEVGSQTAPKDTQKSTQGPIR
jgi:hypothetical protein